MATATARKSKVYTISLPPELARKAEALARRDSRTMSELFRVGREGIIRPGDSVLCLNFRADRMRQLVRALAEPGFDEGREDLPGWRGREGVQPVRKLATLSEYPAGWPYPVAF